MDMGLVKWAKGVARSMAEKAENWALTKLTPLTKASPVFWVLIDTIMSVRHFNKISYKDHMMRVGRFMMGAFYFVWLPQQYTTAFLTINPWF